METPFEFLQKYAEEIHTVQEWQDLFGICLTDSNGELVILDGNDEKRPYNIVSFIYAAKGHKERPCEYEYVIQNNLGQYFQMSAGHNWIAGDRAKLSAKRFTREKADRFLAFCQVGMRAKVVPIMKQEQEAK